MILGFTGTRWGTNEAQEEILKRLIRQYMPDNALHGGCQGSDIRFAQLCREINPKCLIERYPGPIGDPFQGSFKDDIIHPNEKHLARNRLIVRRADVMIGTPYEYEEPSDNRAGGTWWTIRYARKVHKEIIVIMRNGTIVQNTDLAIALF